MHARLVEHKKDFARNPTMMAAVAVFDAQLPNVPTEEKLKTFGMGELEASEAAAYLHQSTDLLGNLTSACFPLGWWPLGPVQPMEVDGEAGAPGALDDDYARLVDLLPLRDQRLAEAVCQVFAPITDQDRASAAAAAFATLLVGMYEPSVGLPADATALDGLAGVPGLSGLSSAVEILRRGQQL